MSVTTSRICRAVGAFPILGIALVCFRVMDIGKMIAHQQPFLQAGKVEWPGGSLPILSSFHYVHFLDDLWRGTTASFSPSTLGYDAVSWWQMFSFLHNLGPLFVVWLLESSRIGNRWSPAYLPTIFAFAGQLLGLGSVAPLFYFLCIAFGPTASDLVRSPAKRILNPESNLALLPILLLLHTAEVFGAFTSSDPVTRHYWTWAWQTTPLWIGVAITVISGVLTLTSVKSTPLASPAVLLLVMSVISSVVWIYTILFCDVPLSSVFIPERAAQAGFVEHMRHALQVDEICIFSSSFVWLAYLFYDLHTIGLMGEDWAIKAALLPAFATFAGPGAAFAFGWYWRESLLQSKLAIA